MKSALHAIILAHALWLASGGPGAFAEPFVEAVDPAASKSRFMTVPESSGHALQRPDSALADALEYDFTLAADGPIQLWVALKARDAGSGSIRIQFDDTDWIRWDGGEAIDTWRWVKVGSYSEFTAGPHTVRLANGENGISIDRLFLGQDPGEEPEPYTLVAGEDSFIVYPGESVLLDVLANDGSPTSGATLSLDGISAPEQGTASIADRFIAYDAPEAFWGMDPFTYTVSHGADARRTTAIVHVTQRTALNELIRHLPEEALSGQVSELRVWRNGDPDGDGGFTALELYLGRDPGASDFPPARLEFESGSFDTLSMVTGPDVAGIAGHLEWSPNLADWYRSDVEGLPAVEQGGGMRRSWRYLGALPSRIYYRISVDDGGLAAYYAFDSRDPWVVEEQTGSGYDLVPVGPVFSFTERGSSLEFDGVDDYASAAAEAVPDFAGGFSIALLIKIADASENRYMRILSTKESWNDERGIELIYNPSQNRLIFCGRGAEQMIASGIDLPAEWAHVAMTLEPEPVSGELSGRFYVNGTEEAQSVVYSVADRETKSSGTLTSPEQSDHDFTIGSYVGGGAWLHASLDELRLFQRVLSPDEITILANVLPPVTDPVQAPADFDMLYVLSEETGPRYVLASFDRDGTFEDSSGNTGEWVYQRSHRRLIFFTEGSGRKMHFLASENADGKLMGVKVTLPDRELKSWIGVVVGGTHPGVR